MTVLGTRAVLLRSFAYGETSRILRFFTEARGTLGVMARGARRSGSGGSGGLDTFAGGILTVHVKETRDLQTLKEFTATRPRTALARSVLRFGGASVLGEVVLRHGGEAENAPLFEALQGGLDALEQAEEAAVLHVLLARGWGLVSALGYHPVVHRCVACGQGLSDDEVGRFDFAAGGVRCAGCQKGAAGPRVGPGARAQLTWLLQGRTDPVTRPRAHLQLLSDFVTYHVSGARPLESFRFLAGLLPPDGSVGDGAPAEGATADEDAP